MRYTIVLWAMAAVLLPSRADITVPIDNHWDGGFQGKACFDIAEEMHGWKVVLTFDKPLSSLDVYVADITNQSPDGKVFEVSNKVWNKDEHVGDTLCIEFQGHGNGDITPTVTAKLVGASDGGHNSIPTAGPPVTAAPGQTLPPATTTTPRPLPVATGDGIKAPMTVNQDWGERFDAQFSFPVTEDVLGWVANITFDKPVTKMDIFIGDAIYHSPDGYNWVVVNKGDHAAYSAGQTIDLKFFGNYQGGSPPPNAVATLTNMGVDNFKVTEAPNKDNSKYNYNDVLYKSILFYEAQRSGKLPDDNRIPWRGDSALGDKGDNGEDLTGGWYDAGDHVKFNFPMAYTTTALAWGFLEFGDGYEAAGQTDYLLDCIKWPLDYLLKCHTAPEELYVQVGDAGADHSYWGPPEEMTMARPAYKINPSNPGSDVAMETASAMAAGYLVFKGRNDIYANILLEHAKQLWEFANKYPGKYSDSVQAAAGFYRSFNETDERCWGSLWLYKATGDPKYLQVAEANYDPEPAWGQSWDEKTIGNQILLYEATNNDKYKQAIINSYNGWFPGGSLPYTPQGLAYRLQWGSLRYASNMAMAALVAAEKGINPTEYRHWAMCQIHYALGDTGFSYLIGFGNSFPLRPHHRSSSCPNLPAPCGPFIMSGSEPNVHTLYGALVGGPGSSDQYTDDRSNYVNNEVATDYNAGFQGAAAGLKHLWVNGEHPQQLGDDQCPYSSGSAVVGR